MTSASLRQETGIEHSRLKYQGRAGEATLAAVLGQEDCRLGLGELGSGECGAWTPSRPAVTPFVGLSYPGAPHLCSSHSFTFSSGFLLRLLPG